MEGRGLLGGGGGLEEMMRRVMEEVVGCREVLDRLEGRMGMVEGSLKRVEMKIDAMEENIGVNKGDGEGWGGEAAREPSSTDIVKEEIQSEEWQLLDPLASECGENDIRHDTEKNEGMEDEYSNTAGCTGEAADIWGGGFHAEVKEETLDEELCDLEAMQGNTSDVRPSLPMTTIVRADKEDKHFETQEHLLQKNEDGMGPNQCKVCWKTVFSQRELHDCVEFHESAANNTKEKANHHRSKTSGGGNCGKRKANKLQDEKERSGNEEMVGRERMKEMEKTLKTKGGRYQCKFCSYEARQKHHLANHLNTHTGEKRYACSHCDRRFANKSHMEGHVNSVHLGKKPYQCKICSQKFSESGKLKSHVNGVHLNLKLHSCDLCGETFASPFNVRRHKGRVHKTSAPSGSSSRGEII